MKLHNAISDELEQRLRGYSDYQDKELEKVVEDFLSEKLKEKEKEYGLVGFENAYFEYSQTREPGSEELPVR